jgi:hypothetical protein
MCGNLRAGGKSRRLVYRLARSYPAAKIALLGCYASLADHSFQHIPQVALIADHRRGIFSALEHYLLHTFSGKSDTLGTPQVSKTTLLAIWISNVFRPAGQEQFDPAEILRRPINASPDTDIFEGPRWVQLGVHVLHYPAPQTQSPLCTARPGS